ncbi:DUF4382 domain-containing protein [Taibaiella soli]|uniref:DUF4382 domain-containing protein n=1 Tax=Taibaiella soli TaxID=1649169 RepID=A0A2W2A9D4_9BACT|nr:DUF4382 domain-containing protein [Taibaiella soli]PZF71881.1 hypothetical protein DN068_17660 [Taibaiella soli]
MKRIIYWAAVLLFGSMIAASCKKDSSSDSMPAGSNNLSVYMTDGPAMFDAVYINIVSIDAKIDTSSHKNDDHFGDDDHDGDDDNQHDGDHDRFGTWINLNFTPGVYNLLDLRNGVDTLIATASTTGTVRKIRIKIGDGSYIIKNGTQYPLTLINWDNNKNYVYTNLHDEDRDDDNPAHIGIWLDFDLGRSIIEKNGHYYLLPVLKPFCDRKSAQIEGKVLPMNAAAVIQAYNATDTAMAFPNADGYFKIRGLNTGTYNVLFHSTNGYIDTTIMNVSVSRGHETELRTVTLHQ